MRRRRNPLSNLCQLVLWAVPNQHSPHSIKTVKWMSEEWTTFENKGAHFRIFGGGDKWWMESRAADCCCRLRLHLDWSVAERKRGDRRNGQKWILSLSRTNFPAANLFFSDLGKERPSQLQLFHFPSPLLPRQRNVNHLCGHLRRSDANRGGRRRAVYFPH